MSMVFSRTFTAGPHVVSGATMCQRAPCLPALLWKSRGIVNHDVTTPPPPKLWKHWNGS